MFLFLFFKYVTCIIISPISVWRADLFMVPANTGLLRFFISDQQKTLHRHMDDFSSLIYCLFLTTDVKDDLWRMKNTVVLLSRISGWHLPFSDTVLKIFVLFLRIYQLQLWTCETPDCITLRLTWQEVICNVTIQFSLLVVCFIVTMDTRMLLMSIVPVLQLCARKTVFVHFVLGPIIIYIRGESNSSLELFLRDI